MSETLHASPDLPSALCDKARAMQVIGNLLSNASKYTPQGGLIVISLAPAEEEGFLQVSVADNGLGVSAKDQAKLFNRFFRTESAQLTAANGVGLGLYITRALLELHGGRIWFESELGKGSPWPSPSRQAGYGLASPLQLPEPEQPGHSVLSLHACCAESTPQRCAFLVWAQLIGSGAESRLRC